MVSFKSVIVKCLTEKNVKETYEFFSINVTKFQNYKILIYFYNVCFFLLNNKLKISITKT